MKNKEDLPQVNQPVVDEMINKAIIREQSEIELQALRDRREELEKRKDDYRILFDVSYRLYSQACKELNEMPSTANKVKSW